MMQQRVVWTLLACVGLHAIQLNAEPTDAASIISAIQTPRDIPVPYEERTVSPLLEEPLLLSGTVKFDSDGRLSKCVISPVSECISISATEVILQRGGKQQRIALQKDSDLLGLYQLLLAVLAGNFAPLLERFSIDTQSDGDRWRLTLSPKMEESASLLDALTIRGSGNRIQYVRITRASDNWQEIRFGLPVEIDQ